MNIKNKKYLEHYEQISEEMKHITNSLVRLHLLFSLFDSPKTMKELNSSTSLSYSAISSNIHALEASDYVEKDGNCYILSNVMELYIRELLEFNKTLAILKEFFNLFESHKVRNLPVGSISELYMIENSVLIESCGIDVYKVNEVIIDTLRKAHEVKAVLPISFQDLTLSMENFIEKEKRAELKIAYDIFEEVTRNIDLESNNVKVKEFRTRFNFLLIIANETMILGFYKKDGSFDQNRIIISKAKESLKWANRLFNSI